MRSFSQVGQIDLAKLKLCELTVDDLKGQDPDLKRVSLLEMGQCAEDIVLDGLFECGYGYESKWYPGVVFQISKGPDPIIYKIHLTRNFKGYLPDGNYLDLSHLKVSDVLRQYDVVIAWTSRDCSDYWTITNKDKGNFYVKIDKNKHPRFPVDQAFYAEQLVQGVDLIIDCASYVDKRPNQPLYLIDGKESIWAVIKKLKSDDIESVKVLKDQGATEKYGERGKYGVVEIILKKK
ncbi:MAG: hypothetical protein CFE24_10160 [Flavobacterium sp. BFFFF2]|nr:MAG: hypothetical protein CFE24_10160 [Flavobacterium sp. BFFFF2]